ncbi:hypothetical protein ACFLUZ_02790 [Chloroflexota bacterium]
MAAWHEFGLWYVDASNPNADDIFAFKKIHLLPMLERYGMEDFLMLDEDKFMVLRIDTNGEYAKRIFSDLEDSIQTGRPFSRVTMGSWSPITDAKNRILSAREEVKKLPEIQGLSEIPPGGWMIKGKTPNGKWEATSEDLDKQAEAFSIFMSKVVGKFTKAYLKEMPYRVENRWLMSVFLHLILHSISTSTCLEEAEIREFPYV